jgi:hypothetical protein
VVTTNLTFTGGLATLAGTLCRTELVQPGPVVLLVSGSGPIDRDSNMKKLAIGVMGRLAEHLSGAGLASFRYDKRGVGESGGDYLAAGFRDNVADASAAIEMLRARPEVDPEQVSETPCSDQGHHRRYDADSARQDQREVVQGVSGLRPEPIAGGHSSIRLGSHRIEGSASGPR